MELIWRRQKSYTSHGCNRRRRKLEIFLNNRNTVGRAIFSSPRACIEAELEIFPSPRAQEKARVWNFSESQDPYKGGELLIFPSPRDYMKAVLGIFLSPRAHIDMGVPNPMCIDIFLHIPTYFDLFLRICYIKEFQNVKGCTRKS